VSRSNSVGTCSPKKATFATPVVSMVAWKSFAGSMGNVSV